MEKTIEAKAATHYKLLIIFSCFVSPIYVHIK